MIERILTIKKLAETLQIKESTLRIWLAGWRFSKYEAPNRGVISYTFNLDFLNTMVDFLENQRLPKYDIISNVKKLKQNLINLEV